MENAVNCGANRDDAERLHHWLHLIAESDERDIASVLVAAVAESLGGDAVGRFVDAVQEQAEAVRQ
ncbi:MAG: hypothetical protein F9B45_14865 [Phycisphaera sp. RhM]|nr:hypothetical protein [Phycisphaera sp. RhM]